MKALLISNDLSLFEERSPARVRMRAYAEAIGTLHIISAAPKEAKIEEGPLTLHGISVLKLERPFVLARRAREIIANEGIEVVSAQDPFEHGWAALRAVRGTSAKLHIQVHTDFLSPWFLRSGINRSPQVTVPFLNRIRKRMADEVLPKADGIRAVSSRVRDSLRARYGNRIKDPSVIPVGVASQMPSPVSLPPHTFSFVLLTAGRLEPEKRIEDILYALARIGYRYSTVGLIVVGDGSERPLLERITRKLGLSDRVVFAGMQEEGAWGMMRSANAYIQASAYEGYGRTLIEAAIAGIPIITTDVGIVGDVLVGYEDVLAAPPGDPAALATHIIGLVEDHQARETFAMNAKRKAEAHLTAAGNLPMAVADDLARTLITR